MKAVILAAGKGTRMLPLTEDRPKVLIEINGKPFLWYLLENLRKAGISEYGIIVNYQKEKIKDFLEKYKIKATFIDQPEPSGTGDAYKQAREFCGKEDFIGIYGDNLYSVEDLKAVQKHDSFCYVVGKEVDDWQKYGILVVKGEKLIKIVEKPKKFVGNIANIGLYKFTSDLWPALEKMKPSPRGEYEITDAISSLARERKVKVSGLQEYWLDLGCKEDIPKISGFLARLSKGPLRKIASIILVNKKGELLLLLRDNNPAIPFPHHWDLLGGHVEEGETPEEALGREIKEELNLDIRKDISDLHFFKRVDCFEGDVHLNIKYIYVGRIDKRVSELELNEGERLAFFSPEEARKLRFANIIGSIVKAYIQSKQNLYKQ